MNIIAAFFHKLGTLFSSVETKVAGEIKTLPERNWASLRWIGLIAFACLVYWVATTKILTDKHLEYILVAFIAWLASNTITRVMLIWGNTKVHVAEITTLKTPEDSSLDPDQGESTAQILAGQTGAAPSVAQQIIAPAAPTTKTP